MGYSERWCRICGMSFNVARFRTADEGTEPQKMPHVGAGWTETGDCGPNTGCLMVFPEKCVDDDTEEDTTYVYESADDEDAYEYESDDDLLDQQADVQEPTPDGEGDERADEQEQNLYQDWIDEYQMPRILDRDSLNNNGNRSYTEAWYKYVISPIRNLNNDERFILRHNRHGQCHVSGLGCLSTSAYNGHRITAEEAKGSHVVQCLIKKDPGWVPSADDESFEIEGDYFLSGISDYMPSRDEGDPLVSPHRHGVERPNADDIVWGLQWQASDVDEIAIPFHPTCFEVYKHASRLHFGHFDLFDLSRFINWRYLESSYESVHEFPRDPAVNRGRDQWWQHHPGDEWLAANPVFIPALLPILQAAKTEEIIDPNQSILETRRHVPRRSSPTHPSRDPFRNTPQELKDKILSYLGSKDIANLRLASREFVQLPVSLWYRLLREEMPWLWEMWSDKRPSFWATTTQAAIKEQEEKRLEKRQEYDAEIQQYRRVIREDMPELLDEWELAEPSFEDYAGPELQLESPVVADRLPQSKTNWYRLYRGITVNWKDLKGLQNRRRIWEDCEEIIRRIKKYQEAVKF